MCTEKWDGVLLTYVVLAPGCHCTLYPMIGEPSALEGGDQPTTSVSYVAVENKVMVLTGCGGAAGATKLTVADGPSPFAFVAVNATLRTHTHARGA